MNLECPAIGGVANLGFKGCQIRRHLYESTDLIALLFAE
jgi:hypothetical protein